ncbi:hypothetical protein NLJ89_g159 [Agrocybe chaxingu]|uniref:BRCT domain-containing protein n=1 Tax=Agrocybe chaxingu TaxID=84603 RepID=A0A9W8N2R2_9AGAR|nr:hypothetical protein NLJ89_g159 [Agrocybe chaxingu]
MEAYFPVVARQQTLKPSASKLKKEDTGEDRGSCSPYEVADGELGVAETKCSSSTITKRLLATLSDESNPITHSDIRLRSGATADHIVSFASGHQVAEERVNQRLYLTARERKLSVQREAFSSRSGPSVFKDVKIYIDGYLESTTDIEIKRLVSEGGGQAVQSNRVGMYAYHYFKRSERLEDPPASQPEDKEEAPCCAARMGPR